MDFEFTQNQNEIREAVRGLCSRFGIEYWRKCDETRSYPEEFVRAMTEAGWLAALIPEEYGGAGLGISEAAVVLEEINRCGGNGGACHAQMYTMASVLHHGTEVQKRKYLPEIAKGSLRLQSFGVTEPDAGSDTTRIKTFARRNGRGFVINGQKIFTSRFQHSDMILLMTRSTPLEQVKKRTDGMSLFLVDLKEAGDAIRAVPIQTLVNHETNQLFIENLEVSEDQLIGQEGMGFHCLLSSLNAERILVASEAVGDAGWLIEQAVRYARERIVFNRPIGSNQGIQFPIARAEMSLRAADLMRLKAAALFDADKPCGPEANMAKFLCAEAAWEAAEAAMTTFGGYGFARDFHIERKWRETRLLRTAPISGNLILSYVGEHVLGMPRSY